MNFFLQWDENITNWLYLETASPATAQIIYYFASILIYGLPVLLIWMAYNSSRGRVVATKIFIAAIVAWQAIASTIGNVLYNGYGWRERPFAQLGYDELLFEQPAKAFPSDHATVLFAAVFLLYFYGYKKIGNWLLAASVMTGLARVVIGFHWFGDIVGGVIIALFVAVIFVLIDKPLDRLISKLDATLIKRDKLF